ncbi:M23 family metallopeptidase [Phenylobacterium sp.]|uniref:M23 family metallopeptidase n=1 Tax=Phenylobacterium sp. TaxID=1871053 RepID=UPI00301D969A
MRLAPSVLTAFALGASAALTTPATAQAPGARTPGPQASGAPPLTFPVACQPGRTCEIQHYVDRDPGPGVRDHRCGTMTYEGHNGVDIRLPDLAAQRRGVVVLAAAAGRVRAVRDGKPDISVKAAGAPSVAGEECGNGVAITHDGGWETQYCHMARGSIAVNAGQAVEAGAPLGRIGLSGQTEYPHLHFTVRRAGRVVDPFRPDEGQACGDGAAGLWTPEAAARMPYRAGAILNAGFAAAPVTMDQIEGGAIGVPDAGALVLVAYARAIALLPGDEVELDLKGPDGASLARSRRPPLASWRAQEMLYIGKRRPAAGWPRGTYTAEYRVWRKGVVVLSRRFQTTL